MGGSSTSFGFGVELAEGVDEGVEVLGWDGLQGGLSRASFWGAGFGFHRFEYTRSPPIFRTPSTPLDKPLSDVLLISRLVAAEPKPWWFVDRWFLTYL